jgi:hypothetical protein
VDAVKGKMHAPRGSAPRGNPPRRPTMQVKSSSNSIQYHKVGNHYIRLECDDDCGSGAVVWGFLAAAIWMILVVIVFCF